MRLISPQTRAHPAVAVLIVAVLIVLAFVVLPPLLLRWRGQ